jgi:hypothetical protein
MFDPILLALRDKVLTMEADRYGFGWTALPASMYVISVDGPPLRHQAIPRPSGLHTDPPHLQAGVYAIAAATVAALSVAGVPVAACFIAELCPGCLSGGPPWRIRKLWHAWRHQPTVRVLVAVDVAGAHYYLQHDRDGDSDVVLYISTPPEPGFDSEPAVLLYQAMVELLAIWRASTERGTGPEEGDGDAPSRRLTPRRGGDPHVAVGGVHYG